MSFEERLAALLARDRANFPPGRRRRDDGRTPGQRWCWRLRESRKGLAKLRPSARELSPAEVSALLPELRELRAQVAEVIADVEGARG